MNKILRFLGTVLLVLIFLGGGYLGVLVMAGNTSLVDDALYFSYIVFTLTMVIVLIAVLWKFIATLISKPKEILGILIFVLFLGIIFVVSYALSSPEVKPYYINITPTVSRISETLIYSSYFLFALTVLAFVLSGVFPIIRKIKK